MIQGIHRYIKKESILLDLDALLDVPDEFDELAPRKKQDFKRQILTVLVGLFEHSARVVNPSKCLTDLCNREQKATTAMGQGVALPHVRTLQARDFMVAVMRSQKGVYFNSLDEEPVHLFVGIICPPYEDKKYLSFLSALSRAVNEGDLVSSILAAESEDEIVGIICRYR